MMLMHTCTVVEQDESLQETCFVCPELEAFISTDDHHKHSSQILLQLCSSLLASKPPFSCAIAHRTEALIIICPLHHNVLLEEAREIVLCLCRGWGGEL